MVNLLPAEKPKTPTPSPPLTPRGGVFDPDDVSAPERSIFGRKTERNLFRISEKKTSSDRAEERTSNWDRWRRWR